MGKASSHSGYVSQRAPALKCPFRRFKRPSAEVGGGGSLGRTVFTSEWYATLHRTHGSRELKGH